jgi:hypothetical protein
MIRYIDENTAEVGDTILIDNGERTDRVCAVIEHESEIKEWGTEQPGLMIKSDHYGLLFIDVEQIGEDECRLIRRAIKPRSP